MSEPPLRKQPALDRSSVFAGLSPSARELLLRDARFVDVERKGVLFEAGAPADHLFVIAVGRVRLLRRGPENKEITFGYRGAGDVVGLAGFGAKVHHAEARAADRLEALRIPRPRVESAMEEDGAFAHRFVSLLAREVARCERRMEALLTKPVESRVAQFLLDAASRHGVPDSRGSLIGVKFTHHEIASYVGSTRETVTLVLGDMKRRGLIGIDHRRIIVRDSQALADLV